MTAPSVRALVIGAPYSRLRVWHKALDVTKHVYRLTEGFPPRERYELASQLRRAANIAEGCARGSEPQYYRFTQIAYGSLRECETLLILSAELGFVSAEDVADTLASCAATGRMLLQLIRYLRRKSAGAAG